MKTKTVVGISGILVLACAVVSGAASGGAATLVAGGTETMIGSWLPGRGTVAPGAKLRGWVAEYRDVLVGPAGELATASGPVTMNCNLDQALTGPCWGTFEFGNATGTWTGVWHGTFDFATGAGSYSAVGHGQGGLKGMTIHNEAVYPGYAFAVNGVPTGYLYSTVRTRVF